VLVVKCNEAQVVPLLLVKSERARRLHAFGVSIVAIALLGIAFFLTPSTEGIGTHRQLGLPTCSWILIADLPCPTCGMTTAWSHTVRGELLSAFVAQPLGMLLAIVAFLVAIGGLITTITGYSFKALLYMYSPSTIFIFVGALVLVSWSFKIFLHRGVL
jgi:hypothetical protein